MKKVLVVTQYIYPEPFKSSELVFELAIRGYKVDVLTGIPNYPEGHYYNGYGLFTKRIEHINGVSFYRCFQTPRKLFPGLIGIGINYITFLISSICWIFFFFIWRKKYDAIITHEPSPITQIIPACIYGNIKNVPVYSWIQDIWPDSLVSAAGKKGELLSPILAKITDWVYKNSTKILITSKGMADLVNRNADYNDKLIYYPQWSDDMYVTPDHIPDGIDNLQSEKLTIMMAGSLNGGIGVPYILSLCEEMKNDPVQFIFVGSGSEKENMQNVACEKRLSNLHFIGRKPSSEMPYYYTQADILLLTLKPTNLPHLEITIPARLQSYMSAGKPIFAMIGKGASEIINDAECGFCVKSGDFLGMAQIIREKALKPNKNLSIMGKNGRAYYLNNFTKKKCIDNLCNLIEGRI